MKFFTSMVAAVAATIMTAAVATPAVAATVALNSTPADGWFYGSGNGYSPANTSVLTTNGGTQLYLRAHETFQVAPASVGNVYSFATGVGKQISFDWGIDGAVRGQLITLKNLTTNAVFSYDPFFVGNDNATGFGSAQNSARLNFGVFAPLGFNPNVNNSYEVNLSVTGADGARSNPYSNSIIVKMGAGAVPEPATWAMMIFGFGAVGTVIRRSRSSARLSFI